MTDYAIPAVLRPSTIAECRSFSERASLSTASLQLPDWASFSPSMASWRAAASV